MKSRIFFLQGFLGGFCVVAFLIIILISASLFNYRITIEKVNINTVNDTIVRSVSNFSNSELKKVLISKLQQDKSILTPNEYTNNVVSYYNSLLLILSVMLAGFSVLSFVYIKSLASDFIQEKLNSNGFKEDVSNRIAGDVESRLREDIQAINTSIAQLQNYLAQDKNENDQIIN